MSKARYLGLAILLVIGVAENLSAGYIFWIEDTYPLNPTSFDHISLQVAAVCISAAAISVNVHGFTIDLITNPQPRPAGCVPEPHEVSVGIGPVPAGTYTVREISQDDNGQPYTNVIGSITVISLAIPAFDQVGLLLLVLSLAGIGIATLRRA